jgi:hypothetical protein
MSPTIIHEQGMRIAIFFNDHPPAHVHAFKGDGMARIYLDPVALYKNEGLSRKDLKIALEIVAENQAMLLEYWRQIHGEDNDAEDQDES